MEDWVADLAGAVHSLLCGHSDMLRFREMVKKYEETQAAEFNAVKKWGQLRWASLSNVVKDSRLQDRQTGPPEPGWVWLRDTHEAGIETFKRGSDRLPNVVEGWVPPEVAEPCPERTELINPTELLPLEYKYARLAAIHDYVLNGVEPVDPPEWRAKETVRGMAYYVLMRDTAHLSDEARPVGERALFQAFLQDVREDLARVSPAGLPDDFTDVVGLPADMAAILRQGDFPTLSDDEYAKLGAWLSANARKVYSGLDPANVAKTQRMEEAKKRLRAILEYNTALRQQTTPAVVPANVETTEGAEPKTEWREVQPRLLNLREEGERRLLWKVLIPIIIGVVVIVVGGLLVAWLKNWFGLGR